MKNIAAYTLSIALLAALGFGFSSCKEDEPPAKPKLSFAETEMTVSEDDGIIEVEVVLDKAYSKDLRIEYELGGTADDQDVVGTANADYIVKEDHGVVEIESGETSGTIRIEIYSDAKFEADETIEIAIVDTNTDEVELTADDETVITITNDDAQITATFGAGATMTVNEDDGVDANGEIKYISVPVQLDKPATSEVTIEYSIDGTALDSLLGFEEEIPGSYWDYYVHGTSGVVTIPAGQTAGKIEFRLYSDFMFEGDETIELTLTGGEAAIGTANKATVTINQQNGKVIALVWDEAHADVDMDMFLWIGETVTTLEGVLASALTPRTTPRQELIIIPTVIADAFEEAAFGLSFVYYSGTANPMNFEVHYADFVDGEIEGVDDREIFAAAYTLANINAWDQSDVDPIVVQTFRIVAGEFVDLTDITVPSSGSRMRTHRLPKGLERRLLTPSRPL